MPILDWDKKDQAVKEASHVPYRLLEVDESLCYGDSHSGNVIIQGDNLSAMKALLPYYKGLVKCCYIDPPYNADAATNGQYNDNFEHSQWLSILYPRLELIREFLAEDGSVWISIDDEEQAYLRVICDEIFGRQNFIANNIWEKKYSPQNDAKWMSDSHDFILCYAKNKQIWRPNLLARTDEMNARYKNPDNDPRGPWKSSDFSVRTYNESSDYPITLPSGRVVTPPASRCWGSSEDNFKKMVEDNRIWFGTKGNNVPSVKKFLSEVQQGSVCKTIWFRNEVGDNQEAKKEVKVFNKSNVFTTPKPERLIKRVLSLSTHEGDLILDAFVGSGTSAAVAQKMNRHYIGIELGEHALTHVVPRLKKVIDGEDGGISKETQWTGGGGYRFFRLGEPLFDEYGVIRQDVRFKELAAHVWRSELHEDYLGDADSPLLGVSHGIGYYLLYNGILGDKKPAGGNVLTMKLLRNLPEFDGPKVIYGEACRIGETHLKQLHIEFRQIPYNIKIG